MLISCKQKTILELKKKSSPRHKIQAESNTAKVKLFPRAGISRISCTVQKIKFIVKNFFSKCNQILKQFFADLFTFN